MAAVGGWLPAPGTAVLSGGDIIGGEKAGMMSPGGVIWDTVVVVMTALFLNGGPIPSEELPPASIIDISVVAGSVMVVGAGVTAVAGSVMVVGAGIAISGVDIAIAGVGIAIAGVGIAIAVLEIAVSKVEIRGLVEVVAVKKGVITAM